MTRWRCGYRGVFMCAAEESKPGAAQPELPSNAGAETIARLDKVLMNSYTPKASLVVQLSSVQLRRVVLC